VNVPVFWNVKLNCALGASVPLNTPLSLVAVCVVESLFVHVTVVPALTVSGFGEYAVVVKSSAPATMETGVPLAPVDGDVGVELLVDEPPPQELASVAAASMNANRKVLVMPGRRATRLPIVNAKFWPETRASVFDWLREPRVFSKGVSNRHPPQLRR
jgi:hypothetical protein